MKGLFSPTLLLALAFVSVILALSKQSDVVSHYRFEVGIIASAPGTVRIDYDAGNGFISDPALSRHYSGKGEAERIRVAVPFGTYERVRLEFDGHGRITIARPRFITKRNTLLRLFTPSDFSSVIGAENVALSNEQIAFDAAPGGVRPSFTFESAEAVELSAPHPLIGIGLWFIVWFAAAVAVAGILLLVFDRVQRKLQPTWDVLSKVARAHPKRMVLTVAALAVAANSYPIIFLGRSMVSPNAGTVLLYERSPTLPGMQHTVVGAVPGSDVGAMIWHHVPYSIIQHEAIFEHGELPLWNRYNSGGAPMIGQGQSMFGDPIHAFVILFNGAAWAWDLKFMVGKWLLALALGLIVLHTTGSLSAAALTALSAPFCGVFLYRMNHPALASFCYAPMILYCWIRMVDAGTWRSTVTWCGAILVASWTEMNSGTAKEANTLLLFMNFAGCLTLFCSNYDWRLKTKKLALAIWMGVIFALLTSPVWVTFLHTLKSSWIANHHQTVYQLFPGIVIGLFDEIFYRTIHNGIDVVDPSANFLVLAGVLYAIATFRRVALNRVKLAVSLCALCAFVLAFGLVPPQFLASLPLVATIDQFDNVISLSLIVFLFVIAGFGYKAAFDRLGTPEGRGDLIVAGVLFAGILFMYISLTHGVSRTSFALLRWGQQLPVPKFAWAYLATLVAGMLLLALATLGAKRRGRWTLPGGIVAVTCIVVFLCRFGLHGRIGASDYVYQPAARADFHAPSESVKFMQTDTSEPFRVTGFGGNLFTGWTPVYKLEGHSGPEALINRHYREVVDAAGFNRTWVWRWELDQVNLPQCKPACDFLNIKYYADLIPEDKRVTGHLRFVQQSDMTLYVSDSAWPRAFFTDRLSFYNDVGELGNLVKTCQSRPFATMENIDRLEAPKLPELLTNRSVNKASSYRLTANTTAFDVVANGPGIIVLQEAWLKDDIQVEVNGRPSKCLRVNHAFRGVAVEAAGTYRVKFSYWPKHFTLTLTLFGVGLFFTAFTGVIAWTRPAVPIFRRGTSRAEADQAIPTQ